MSEGRIALIEEHLNNLLRGIDKLKDLSLLNIWLFSLIRFASDRVSAIEFEIDPGLVKEIIANREKREDTLSPAIEDFDQDFGPDGRNLIRLAILAKFGELDPHDPRISSPLSFEFTAPGDWHQTGTYSRRAKGQSDLTVSLALGEFWGSRFESQAIETTGIDEDERFRVPCVAIKTSMKNGPGDLLIPVRHVKRLCLITHEERPPFTPYLLRTDHWDQEYLERLPYPGFQRDYERGDSLSRLFPYSREETVSLLSQLLCSLKARPWPVSWQPGEVCVLLASSNPAGLERERVRRVVLYTETGPILYLLRGIEREDSIKLEARIRENLAQSKKPFEDLGLVETEAVGEEEIVSHLAETFHSGEV